MGPNSQPFVGSRWVQGNYRDIDVVVTLACTKVEETGGFSLLHVQNSRTGTWVMFGDLVKGKGYSGGQEKDSMAYLKKEDMPVVGMKFEGWRKAAQKAGRWFRRVEEEAELFLRNWHETERRKAAETDAQRLGQRHPPSGGGGSCPRD